MKKLVALMTVLALSVSLVACGAAKEDQPAANNNSEAPAKTRARTQRSLSFGSTVSHLTHLPVSLI